MCGKYALLRCFDHPDTGRHGGFVLAAPIWPDIDLSIDFLIYVAM